MGLFKFLKKDDDKEDKGTNKSTWQTVGSWFGNDKGTKEDYDTEAEGKKKITVAKVAGWVEGGKKVFGQISNMFNGSERQTRRTNDFLAIQESKLGQTNMSLSGLNAYFKELRTYQVTQLYEKGGQPKLLNDVLLSLRQGMIKEGYIFEFVNGVRNTCTKRGLFKKCKSRKDISFEYEVWEKSSYSKEETVNAYNSTNVFGEVDGLGQEAPKKKSSNTAVVLGGLGLLVFKLFK